MAADEPDRMAATIAPLDQAMAIITTATNEERAGCLIGFHAQGSIDPFQYALWISKANHTYRVGLHAEHFAVHFPSIEDHDLAELFGGETGDEIDKFELVDWEPGPGGVPLLQRLPHRLLGRRVELFDAGGDHVCVLVEAIGGSGGPTPPLRPLRLSDATDITPGHEAEERPEPQEPAAAD